MDQMDQVVSIPEGYTYNASLARIQHDLLEWAEGYYELVSKCEVEKRLKAAIFKEFSQKYNDREFADIPDYYYDDYPTLSRSVLERIRKKKADGRLGLVYNKSKSIFDSGDVQKAIHTILKEFHTIITMERCLEIYCDRFPELPKFSVSSLTRYVRSIKNNAKDLWNYLKGMAEYLNKSIPKFGHIPEGMHPNAIWELDSSPSDIMLQHVDPLTGEIKLKRYSIIAGIDTYTRRTKCFLSETSNTRAILSLSRACILDWGIPEMVRMDNGSDYSSKQTRRFLEDLGIGAKFCTPGRPQQKPYIERFFRTLQHKTLPQVDGYVGANVSERQLLRKQKKAIEVHMTPEQFQEWLDDFCAYYANLPHSELNCSPNEKLNEAIAEGWKPKAISSERALDFLMLRVEKRKVTVNGVSIENRRYFSECLTPAMHKDVWCRFDDDNPNEIYVYLSETCGKDDFLGVCVWEFALSPEEQAEIALRSRKQALADMKNATSFNKAKKKNQKAIKQPHKAINKEGDLELAKPIIEDPTTEAIEGAELGAMQMVLTKEEREALYREQKQARDEILCAGSKEEFERNQELKRQWLAEQAERKAKEEQNKEQSFNRFKSLFFEVLGGKILEGFDKFFYDNFSSTYGDYLQQWRAEYYASS